MRLLPLGFVLSVATVFVSMLFGVLCQAVNASPSEPGTRQRDYTINGREYQENGIVFDIPKEDSQSRSAEVVCFPNKAIIPSFVTVNGIRYVVDKIRWGASQTLATNSNGWVTLPTSMKYCDLNGAEQTGNHHDGFYTYFYGVYNVNVTDLDSFLSMDYFHQYVNLGFFSSEYPDVKWRLCLNGKELKNYDYVYPEGASMGVSLQNLHGVRSVTIPASDTVRTEPQQWWGPRNSAIENDYPKKVQFKADSGYDLSLYNITADTLVMPRYMTELNGYGTGDLGQNRGEILKYVCFSEKLEVIRHTWGLPDLNFDELPGTVSQILAGKYYSKEETLIVPSYWEKLGRAYFYGRKTPNGELNYQFKKIVIEESENPLYVEGSVKCVADAPVFQFGRNVIYKDASSYFITGLKDATIIIGAKVTELPEHIPLRGYNNVSSIPKYLVCKGLTPPNFPTDTPEILKWRNNVTLVVPEKAAEAYRNHPVWKNFTTTLTNDVEEIPVGKEVVGEQWHSLDGLLLSKPEPGKINIKVTTYSDGTTATSKVAIPE